jgi:hypothetical protein
MTAVRWQARAELDVPGETGRQARVFALWLVCLMAAAALASYRRADRVAIAAGVALLLPALLTWALARRHRRGGGHARGIVVDLTADGELRLWGRGYGQRVVARGADLSERLVDVYGGRLGAWRQRRLTVRGARAIAGSPAVLELACLADPQDDELDLSLTGGEGDCVELSRADYLALLTELRGTTDERNAKETEN